MNVQLSSSTNNYYIFPKLGKINKFLFILQSYATAHLVFIEQNDSIIYRRHCTCCLRHIFRHFSHIILILRHQVCTPKLWHVDKIWNFSCQRLHFKIISLPLACSSLTSQISKEFHKRNTNYDLNPTQIYKL